MLQLCDGLVTILPRLQGFCGALHVIRIPIPKTELRLTAEDYAFGVWRLAFRFSCWSSSWRSLARVLLLERASRGRGLSVWWGEAPFWPYDVNEAADVLIPKIFARA